MKSIRLQKEIFYVDTSNLNETKQYKDVLRGVKKLISIIYADMKLSFKTIQFLLADGFANICQRLPS